MSYRGKSNFVSLLDHISPKVTVRVHTKKSPKVANEVEKLNVPLKDLWSVYEKWSAYCQGVPLTVYHKFEELDTTQYYVPSLSAMQIFTKTPVPGRSSERSFGTDSHLYFEFNETDTFAVRPPLIDKIDDLVKEHQGLHTLTSSDLSQHSWFSVAWSPVCQIPNVSRVDGDALTVSFLTYHSFTPTHQETTRNGKTKVVLPAFGVVTSKLSEKVWIMPGTSDEQNIDIHDESAASWLGMLMFNHSDFDMFMAAKFDDLPLPTGQ